MRIFSAAAVFLCSAVLCAAEPSLKEARYRLLKGNYEEAQAQYEELARAPKNRAAAAVGISRCLQEQGEYDKALETIEAAVKAEPKNADLLARQAELLHFRGRWDEADKAVAAALEQNKDHFLARWVRAQLYRDRGDMKNADAECRWFVRTYSARSNADMDIKDPDELLLVGLAGCENARWHSLSDQFEFILKDVYGDALKYEKERAGSQESPLWPAEYQAGMLLLEKYNRPQALEAFDKALEINPSAAEALVGKGLAAYMKFEFKDAESFAERALKINPRLPDALRLAADIQLAGGSLDKALKDLETARKVNPRDERTLARIAACYFLQGKDKEVDTFVKEVEKFDAKPAVFHYELGEKLEEKRRYDEAEKRFKLAAELRPMLPGPTASLGMLAMRMGREKEATDLLNKAFAADSFNVRVSNTLKVLRHLEKYETLKTEHFVVRYDPKNDEMLAKYLAETLEQIYAELSRVFDYQPKERILVEVFNNHDMFSGRVVALPDLHTIGACTGRMVAMVSPTGKGIRKPFNWGRVMRHEIVHVFNLEQTRFLVPHWLTEGLAVSNEGFPRPQIWNELLRQRVPAGELLNLDTIDLGFIRPRNQLEWNLAYCQSLLYVEYLKKEHGEKVVGELLAAFREGLSTEAALKKVCKADKATIEKGYRAYLDEVVKGLGGRPAEKKRTFNELKAEVEKDPKNVDLTAELAEMYLARDRAEARKLASGVLEKKPNHPTACRVLARLARAAGNPAEERKMLEAGLDRNAPDPKLLAALGKLYYDAGDFAKAAEMFELGRKTEPFEAEWLQQLTRVYAQTGEKKKLIAVLKELVPTDADELDRRKRLAKLLAEEGDQAGAERYARQALEINVKDTEVRDLLYKALQAQKKDAELERLKKILGS